MISRRQFLVATGASALAMPSVLHALGPKDARALRGSNALCSASGKKPNVILILCDDLGWGDIGYWQNQRSANNKIYTPGLDTMMQEGAICTNAYTTAPVCAPARASMVTGKHQGHCNLRDNMFDRPIATDLTIGTVMKQAGYATWHIGKWGIGGGYESKGQPRRAMACDAGFDYSYGYPGHSHGHSFYHWEPVNADWRTDKEESPIIENISKEVYDSASARYKNLSTGVDAFERDTEGTYYRRLIANSEVKYCYDTDLFTAKMKQLIKTHLEDETEKKKPFFCYACYTTVHGTGNSSGNSEQAEMDLDTGYTLHIPPSADEPTGSDGNKKAYGTEIAYPELNQTDDWGGGLKWEKESDCLPKGSKTKANKGYNAQYQNFTNYPAYQGRYATAITRLDSAIKDIRNFLKVKGLDKNTLIVFTSDNGPAAERLGSWSAETMDSNGPFKGMKRWIYEGGLREPTIVVWPETIPSSGTTAPRQCDVPFQFPAWMATLADVAGLPQPAHCDGVSILPALTGSGIQLPMRVYSEYVDGGSTKGFAFEQMVRDGDYVLLRNSGQNNNAAELYNVVSDPGQTNNIAASNPERVRIMTNLLAQCRIPGSKVADAYGATGYVTYVTTGNDGRIAMDNCAIPATMAATGALPKTQVRVYNQGEADWPWVPNFRTMLADRTFVVSAASEIKSQLTDGAYGVAIQGWLDVAIEGDVAFSAIGAGGCQLWIHEAHILEYETGDCASGKSITMNLAAGRHPYRLYLTTTNGTANLCTVTAGGTQLC